MTNSQKAQLLRYFADELAFTSDALFTAQAAARAALRSALVICLQGTEAEAYNLKLGRQLLSPRKSFNRDRFEELINCIETGACRRAAGVEEFLSYHGHKGVIEY